MALVLVGGLEADAQVITKVERRNPNADSRPAQVEIAPGPLAEGRQMFRNAIAYLLAASEPGPKRRP